LVENDPFRQGAALDLRSAKDRRPYFFDRYFMI
jgi:hypothetical protein